MSRPNQDTDKRVMQRIKKAREGNEPTNQQIQERHDKQTRYWKEGRYRSEDWDITHTDRGTLLRQAKASAVELLTAQTENAELLKRLERTEEEMELLIQELADYREHGRVRDIHKLEAAEQTTYVLQETLRTAEQKLKNMPCYREWMLDADGLSGTSCADEAYVHDPLCPVCKAIMEDK